MFHTVEAHSKAAKIANDKTAAKYGDAEFKFNTEKHSFWVRQYDIAFASFCV